MIRTDKTIAKCEMRNVKCLYLDSQFVIRNRHSEKGAALAGLMAMMTIMALLMLAAAPSLVMDTKRSKEEEAIARGEEIAQAIATFARYSNRLPKSIDELREGVSIPGRTKKLMILRESAAIDPLSESGEWKLIQPSDTKTLTAFQRKVVNYTGSNAVENPQPKAIFDPILGRILSSINTETDEEEEEAPGGEDNSQNIDAPFVGVASRSQRKSVIAYYGIERHDRWVFTPLLRGTGNQGGNFPVVAPIPRTQVVR